MPSPIVDHEQVKKAVHALYAYMAIKQQQATTTKTALFDDDDYIFVQVTLKRVPEKAVVKPTRIPLRHPIYGIDGGEVCLFTRDDDKDVKQALKANPLPCLTQTISVTKLRKEYAQYKDRRELIRSYELFLADDCVLPLLPPLLGVKFFEKKRQPAAVNLKVADKRASLERAISSTYFFLPSGPCAQIKVARTTFSRQQTLENVIDVIARVADVVPRRWKNVQSIHVKTGESAAIPIYAADLSVSGAGSASTSTNNNSSANGKDEDVEMKEATEENGKKPASADGLKNKKRGREEESTSEKAASIASTANAAMVSAPAKKKVKGAAGVAAATPAAATTPAAAVKKASSSSSSSPASTTVTAKKDSKPKSSTATATATTVIATATPVPAPTTSTPASKKSTPSNKENKAAKAPAAAATATPAPAVATPIASKKKPAAAAKPTPAAAAAIAAAGAGAGAGKKQKKVAAK